ncbi:hypothetical protein DYH09_32235 [bacterium CPR1]|nr:hypothetical protein [bacterium CPR1]
MFVPLAGGAALEHELQLILAAADAQRQLVGQLVLALKVVASSPVADRLAQGLLASQALSTSPPLAARCKP